MDEQNKTDNMQAGDKGNASQSSSAVDGAPSKDQQVKPGPNAFAQAGRARLEHHIAGNAFAAQARTVRAPPPPPPSALPAIHPALRGDSSVTASVQRAEPTSLLLRSITPAMPTSRGQHESVAARPKTPSHDRAIASRSTPKRGIIDRLKDVHARMLGPERTPTRRDQLDPAKNGSVAPETPDRVVSGASGPAPTPPAKDTPPQAFDPADSPSMASQGTLEIGYAVEPAEGMRRDYSSDGYLPFFGGTANEHDKGKQAVIPSPLSDHDNMSGPMLSPTVFQPSARSSATAVQHNASARPSSGLETSTNTDQSNLRGLISVILKEELKSNLNTEQNDLRGLIFDIFKEELQTSLNTEHRNQHALTTGNLQEVTQTIIHTESGNLRTLISEIVREEIQKLARADRLAPGGSAMGSTSSHLAGAEQGFSIEAFSVPENDIDFEAVVANPGALSALLKAYKDLLDATSDHLANHDSHLEYINSETNKQEGVRNSTIKGFTNQAAKLDSHETSLTEMKNCVKSFTEAAEKNKVLVEEHISNLRENWVKMFDEFGGKITADMKGISDRVRKLERCHSDIRDLHAQVSALSIIVPDDFMVPEEDRRRNEALRTDLIRRAGDHPQLSSTIELALPGPVGYMAWIVDVLREFLPRLERITAEHELLNRFIDTAKRAEAAQKAAEKEVAKRKAKEMERLFTDVTASIKKDKMQPK